MVAAPKRAARRRNRLTTPYDGVPQSAGARGLAEDLAITPQARLRLLQHRIAGGGVREAPGRAAGSAFATPWTAGAKTRRRHQFIRRGDRPSPPPARRSRERKPQIVRARFSSPAFAFATIPWKYPPGEDRK